MQQDSPGLSFSGAKNLDEIRTGSLPMGEQMQEG